MKEFIRKVGEGQNLSREEAASAMRLIMEGQATEAQIAGLLIALKIKGEQTDELLGFVEVMREKSHKAVIADADAIDMCGTGGDSSGTFNISTAASFVVAGAGVTVAKHGNRSISSACGSADVLQALGVNIELSPEKVVDCINTNGIGFLFTLLFHPAMKYAAKPRAELSVKTCFNMLGPMTNPAGVQRQLVGAYSLDAAMKIASVFKHLAVRKIFVVSSYDGLDEISLHSPTAVFEVNGESIIRKYDVEPAGFGIPLTPKSSILGGTADVNASLIRKILQGEKLPHRNYVVANSAFGLLASGKARSIREGVQLAEESLDSGNALRKLNDLIAFGNK
ncbi:MAG: anthranilate phosphoribosyltransferase [Acidobacteria bacterium]|nr:anthranilate phosphoribosyltransferase [Acidobacteriota bacterium]